MADLDELAGQKAEAELHKHLRELPAEIKALQRQLAAKGLLQSGAMLKQVLRLCQQAVIDQGMTVTTQYRWAIEQALVASQSWVERLIKEATESLAPLVDASAIHLTRACETARMPHLAQRLIDDLQGTRRTVENDVALALRSAFADKRRGLIRSFPRSLIRLLSKPFTGGGS